MNTKPATGPQKDYVLFLAKKLYDTLSDDDLKKKLLEMGINVDTLTMEEASAVIPRLNKAFQMKVSTSAEPATNAQKDYILILAKKSNLHDNTLSNEELKQKLITRDGINIDTLTQAEAETSITKLRAKLNYVYRNVGMRRRY